MTNGLLHRTRFCYAIPGDTVSATSFEQIPPCLRCVGSESLTSENRFLAEHFLDVIQNQEVLACLTAYQKKYLGWMTGAVFGQASASNSWCELRVISYEEKSKRPFFPEAILVRCFQTDGQAGRVCQGAEHWILVDWLWELLKDHSNTSVRQVLTRHRNAGQNALKPGFTERTLKAVCA